MVHLRLVAPPEQADRAYALLRDHPSAVNIVRLQGASAKPAGDLILCDVASEDASVLLQALQELGLDREGSIVVEPISSILSTAAVEAERAAVGSPADAVIWETVEYQTSESASLSFSFLAFMAIATMLAALAILQDSVILLIGAMVVGPEFGPLAGVSVALVQRRPALAWRSFKALAIGFPIGIAAAFALTEVLRAVGSAPDDLTEIARPATLFISHPDEYTVLVALLAGIAGGLSLSTAKLGTLMGVLVSVTTIPAAAHIGLSATYREWNELVGAAAQLGLNLLCIASAVLVTLALERRFFRRRQALQTARSAR